MFLEPLKMTTKLSFVICQPREQSYNLMDKISKCKTKLCRI